MVAVLTIGGAIWLHGLLVRMGALRLRDTFVVETIITISIGLFVVVGLFASLLTVEALFITPYVLWREAKEAERRPPAHHLGTATEFELWEAACIIAGVPFQRPVAPGAPFMALEQLRRAFGRRELKLVLTPQQNELIKQSRAAELMGVATAPYPLDDRVKITRETLVSYLDRTDQTVDGLNA